MKTIQFTESKSVDVKITFKTILKLKEASGTDGLNELHAWLNNQKNWAKYLSICAVNELSEAEALDLIDEGNSLEKMKILNSEMDEHVRVFYQLETKQEESIPNA